VAVVAAAILHFVTDVEDPARIVAAFRDFMAPGSHLVITHVVDDGHGAVRKAAELYSDSAAPFVVRSRGQIAEWFDGFRLVPPGLVEADAWLRTGNGRTTAPIVAGVGLLDRSGIATAPTSSGTRLARPREGDRREG
jgi:hypothetical protein